MPERLASVQHLAAVVARPSNCFSALEAALRHCSTMQRVDLWTSSTCSHEFTWLLCRELQRIGAFSSNSISNSSSNTGWELPLLSLVSTNLKLSAAGVARLADQQQQQGQAARFLASTFVDQMFAGCAALDFAWRTMAADDSRPPPCISDSRWQGSRKLQCMAVFAVIRARALTNAGCVLEAVAAGKVPYTADELAALRGACSLVVRCTAQQLQHDLIPCSLQLQLAGPGNATTATAAAGAGAEDAPEWCAVAAAAAAAAGEQSALQQLLEMCQPVNEGCTRAAA
jgi:hypothetical protein